jgi:hypothetical protein
MHKPKPNPGLYTYKLNSNLVVYTHANLKHNRSSHTGTTRLFMHARNSVLDFCDHHYMAETV